MQQSKLLRLLRCLSPEEFKRFYRFLQSPFFNTNPTQIKFYEVLKKEYPGFESPKLTRERVFQKLYPGRAFHYHRMGNLMSELCRLLEEFLVQVEMGRGNFQKQQLLVSALGRRNSYDLYAKGTEELIAELNDLPFRDADFYQKQLELRAELYFHPLSNRYQLGKAFSETVMDNLDRYFALQKLQLSIELKTQERLLSVAHPVRLLQPVLDHNEEIFSNKNPLFTIYSNIYHLLEHPEAAEVFFVTKALFEQHFQRIRGKEQGEILWFLINYAVGKINRGLVEFNREALELYKIGLEYELIMEQGRMTEATFNNIVSAAGMQKEFDWATAFISNYEHYLEEDIRQSVKALGLGELKFRQKLFDDAIEMLGSMQFAKLLHQLKARNLLLKSWFELFLQDEGYYDLLMAQIDSFEKFVKRNRKLSATKAEAYTNLLRLLRNITVRKSQLKFTPEYKAKLLTKIEQHKTLTGKFWLKSRIKAL